MDNSQQMLIIGSVWPEPESSAAGQRMMQLISLFQVRDWQITFASSATKTKHSANLENRGIRSKDIAINSSDFDDFVAHVQPAVVMFDRFITEEQFGWRVAEQCPDALRLLDTEDLHCLRRCRRRAVEQGQIFQAQDLLQDEVAKREVASILRCDLSLIISDYEMELLQNLFNVDTSLLHYLPFLLDPIDQQIRQSWTGFEDRHHFVTIGNFRHPPNWDAVQQLKRDIWPLIRNELPNEELHIYGAYPSQKVRQLHEPSDGFHIKGRAEEAEAVVREAKVCLAPLRFGAGLKGKLVESMVCGTPSVTTSVGAEGIKGQLDWPGSIAENPDEIASAAVELATDKERWQEARQNGIDIINKRFDKDHFATPLVDKVNRLLDNIDQHRQQNFLGAMLRHHTLASTKYMSKWIEEKNKKKQPDPE